MSLKCSPVSVTPSNSTGLVRSLTAIEVVAPSPSIKPVSLLLATSASGSLLAQPLTPIRQLTQTYLELPEPWNNLAVIRAGQGRLDEAQRLLQEALRNNPDYAQAHANLADVLVQQAVQHLHSAQQLAPQASIAQRLQALQQALQATTGSSAPPPAASPTKP